jgi:hypothetical protein
VGETPPRIMAQCDAACGGTKKRDERGRKSPRSSGEWTNRGNSPRSSCKYGPTTACEHKWGSVRLTCRPVLGPAHLPLPHYLFLPTAFLVFVLNMMMVVRGRCTVVDMAGSMRRASTWRELTLQESMWRGVNDSTR